MDAGARWGEGKGDWKLKDSEIFVQLWPEEKSQVEGTAGFGLQGLAAGRPTPAWESGRVSRRAEPEASRCPQGGG